MPHLEKETSPWITAQVLISIAKNRLSIALCSRCRRWHRRSIRTINAARGLTLSKASGQLGSRSSFVRKSERIAQFGKSIYSDQHSLSRAVTG